jgi:hypothetical protein
LLEPEDLSFRCGAAINVIHLYVVFLKNVSSYGTGTQVFTVGEDPVITNMIQGITGDFGKPRVRLRRYCTA